MCLVVFRRNDLKSEWKICPERLERDWLQSKALKRCHLPKFDIFFTSFQLVCKPFNFICISNADGLKSKFKHNKFLENQTFGQK